MSVSAASYSPPSHSSVAKPKNEEEREERKRVYNRYKERVSTLPKGDGWFEDYLYKYQGFWYHSKSNMCMEGVMAVQDSFQAHLTDILLATTPKSGTTWLKALAFAIMNRNDYYHNNDSIFTSNHPLLTTSAYKCVPYLEIQIFQNNKDPLAQIASPRLLATHIPYTLLPESVFSSGCLLVYICRNPKDVLVSSWFFANKLRDKARPPRTLEEVFDLFCKGVSPFGPYWDHVLGYYKASLEHPTRILFLKYEEMRRDTFGHVKRLAEFLGQPFTMEEESQGVVEHIIELCSFEKMSSLEVNKNGILYGDVTNSVFFREGKIGDSVNYLTAEMIKRIDCVTEEKFGAFNLSF